MNTMQNKTPTLEQIAEILTTAKVGKVCIWASASKPQVHVFAGRDREVSIFPEPRIEGCYVQNGPGALKKACRDALNSAGIDAR